MRTNPWAAGNGNLPDHGRLLPGGTAIRGDGMGQHSQGFAEFEFIPKMDQQLAL